MKILFIGDDWVGSNARSFADGFRGAGHDVVVVDATSVSLPTRLSPPWMYAKVRHDRAPWSIENVHRRIDTVAAQFRPDLVMAVRTIHLDQRRLLDIPAKWHVFYSPDDVSNTYNTSPQYLAHEAEWDLVVTTKQHNVPELIARGARATKFVWSAYDPAWHRLAARRSSHNYLVGFIGACRPDRRDHMVELARTHGSKMLVQGPGWRRVRALQTSDATVSGPVYGEEFSVAIASVLANLVLLNSDNRDTHTCRTFEVPAAGGLFVGERTDEHAELLDDRTECFLFSDQQELAEILLWCEKNQDKARDVARRGYLRITEGSHTYADRAREIIDVLA